MTRATNAAKAAKAKAKAEAAEALATANAAAEAAAAAPVFTALSERVEMFPVRHNRPRTLNGGALRKKSGQSDDDYVQAKADYCANAIASTVLIQVGEYDGNIVYRLADETGLRIEATPADTLIGVSEFLTGDNAQSEGVYRVVHAERIALRRIKAEAAIAASKAGDDTKLFELLGC